MLLLLSFSAFCGTKASGHPSSLSVASGSLKLKSSLDKALRAKAGLSLSVAIIRCDWGNRLTEPGHCLVGVIEVTRVCAGHLNGFPP